MQDMVHDDVGHITYDRACKGCIYFGRVGSYGCCNYIFIVGKPRPCSPGKDCTVKETRQNKRREEMDNRVYAVRDTDTGKLVSDITNPRRKYWDRKDNALAAIQNGIRNHRHKNMKLVVFELVEVEEDV